MTQVKNDPPENDNTSGSPGESDEAIDSPEETLNGGTGEKASGFDRLGDPTTSAAQTDADGSLDNSGDTQPPDSDVSAGVPSISSDNAGDSRVDTPDDGTSFDVERLEAVASPSVRPPISQEEADPSPDPTFEPSAVRARIDKLVEQNTMSVYAGKSNIVSLGVARPDHFGAPELKAAADRPIDWMAKDVWTQRAKILLASEPKAGKTWLVCEIAQAVASGDMMFDRIEILDPGPVGIIAAEDDEGEIGRRFDRMCRAKGKLMSNLDLHWWPGDAIRLNRPRDIDWIREQVVKYDIKLMIYDPLARLMDGDENSKECVSQVLTPASQMVRDLGCSVMLVHHLGKDDPDRPKSAAQRVRGSSDIRSWYTTGLFLSGALDQGRVNLELEQRVRGRLPTDFPIRAVEVEEQSVYGLGTLKLVANIERNGGADGTNEQLVENAARKILDLAKDKSWLGLSTSEIGVHLRLGRTLMNAALKKLIREEQELEFESAPDIPDGKVLVLTKTAPSPSTSSAQPAAGAGKAAKKNKPKPSTSRQMDADEEELFG